MTKTQIAEAQGMADARKDARYELWNPRSTGKAYRRGYSHGTPWPRPDDDRPRPTVPGASGVRQNPLRMAPACRRRSSRQVGSGRWRWVR